MRQKIEEGRKAIQDDPVIVQQYLEDLHKRLKDAGIDSKGVSNLGLTIPSSPTHRIPRKRKGRDSPSDQGGSPSGQPPAKPTAN
jgi:hypothetical protein